MHCQYTSNKKYSPFSGPSIGRRRKRFAKELFTTKDEQLFNWLRIATKKCLNKNIESTVEVVHWFLLVPTAVRQQFFLSALSLFLFIQLLSNLFGGSTYVRDLLECSLCPLLLFQQQAFYHGGHQLVLVVLPFWKGLIAWRRPEWHDVIAFLKAFSLLFSFTGIASTV